MTEPIKGKVARILNEREIAINLGTSKGITVGMYFDVIDSNGENIEDPDTGEVLGSIDRPKVRVEVIHVQDKLSIATTYEVERLNIGGEGRLGPFAHYLMPPKWIEKYETLRTRDKGWLPISERQSYVNVGDSVVQVNS